VHGRRPGVAGQRLSEVGVRSVLVRGPNWTGDVVMSTPGFRALRAAHPAARLVLALRPGLVPLLDGAPWFDAVVPVEDGGGPGRLRSLWREGRWLRREHGPFDLGLAIPDSWSSALLLRAAGVARAVGYARAGRGVLLHQALRAPAAWGPRRLVARERFVLGLVEALGCPPRGTRLELHTTPAEETAATRMLEDAGVDPGGRFVALAPGAGYGPSKLWPAERFAAVADGLADRGWSPVLLGAPAERPLARRVLSAMRAPAVDLVGRGDLGAAKALLRRAALLVCNDAGLRHVAVAFGVPAVTVLGPTSLEKTDCNLEGVRVLETDVSCRPCYLRRCPIDHRCMTRIPAERALETSLELLGRRAGAP